MNALSSDYTETGGARYGSSIWNAWNSTYPFAEITIKSETISLHVGGFLKKADFLFIKTDIIEIRKKRGLFSTAIQIKHSRPATPLFILFWTFHFSALKRALEMNGYVVNE